MVILLAGRWRRANYWLSALFYSCKPPIQGFEPKNCASEGPSIFDLAKTWLPSALALARVITLSAIIIIVGLKSYQEV